jgi:dCTP deaminase
MLTRSEIIRLVFSGDIKIDPFELSRLGPNSYDLTLGNKLLIYKDECLDPKIDNPSEELIIPSEGLVLKPGVLYLGSTVEKTGSSYYVPILHGRSSAARLGITTHLSAGFGDLGWFGAWTLELMTLHKVRIYPGMSLCQVAFEPVTGEILQGYTGRYQDQTGVTTSRAWIDSLGAK